MFKVVCCSDHVGRLVDDAEKGTGGATAATKAQEVAPPVSCGTDASGNQVAVALQITSTEAISSPLPAVALSAAILSVTERQDGNTPVRTPSSLGDVEEGEECVGATKACVPHCFHRFAARPLALLVRQEKLPCLATQMGAGAQTLSPLLASGTPANRCPSRDKRRR